MQWPCWAHLQGSERPNQWGASERTGVGRSTNVLISPVQVRAGGGPNPAHPGVPT
jgi:hypothetical protein